MTGKTLFAYACLLTFVLFSEAGKSELPEAEQLIASIDALKKDGWDVLNRTIHGIKCL